MTLNVLVQGRMQLQRFNSNGFKFFFVEAIQFHDHSLPAMFVVLTSIALLKKRDLGSVILLVLGIMVYINMNLERSSITVE